jgi:soluble lytic murein transglycosylase
MLEYQNAYDQSQEAEIRAAALLGLGRAHWMLRHDYEAVSLLQKIVSEFPETPQTAEAHFYLGEIFNQQERYGEAVTAYTQYLSQRSGVIDAYVLDRRADMLFATGDYAAAARDFQAAIGTPSTLDTIFIQMKLARSYALGNDPDTALTLYDDVYYRSSNPNTRALVNLRKGEIYTSLGKLDLAQAAYLDSIQNYPTAYESYLCLSALVDSGVVVDELLRGKVDYYAGQYGVALAAFDRYLQSNPADPGSANYFYGLTTRALGGHAEAITYWDKVINEYKDHTFWDDAYEQKAYTQWAYLNQNEQATATYLEFVEKAPAHERAGEFLYDAALSAERDGKLELAAELFERVTNLYPGYSEAARSIFLSGISAYRLDDYDKAMAAFMRYETIVVTLQDRAAANFWIAKTHSAREESDYALAAFQKAAGIDPTGYYSERARDILHSRDPFTPPQAYDIGVDFDAERRRAEEWMRSTFNLPEDVNLSGLGSLANDGGIQRGAALWQLGLYDEARGEFESVRLSLLNDPVQTFRLLNYMLELGAYRTAIMAARQVLDNALLDDASTLGAPIYFNHIRFGTYYSDLLFPLAQESGFHPLFVFSLVRQESLFEGFVRSSAGARGLMQIMPATGADIHKNLAWPTDYTSEDLYRPLVSLKYGIHYLAKQRDAFDGNLYAALAAYNGGPGNSIAWLKLAPNDPDLFLEIIRYSETRNYIRGIYEIFSLYRKVYDRTP